ncbi:MAG TPA: CHRD domain-containing protein [Caulobacteraceae bacterium]|nr:CHRD domain-containing protein [Caulobacteraceae bacterium]
MGMRLFVVTAAVAVLAAGAASAATLHFTAKMDGASETPPNDSKGTGTAAISLDTATKKLDWKAEYSGLSGPATMAHFHGPAPAGKAAPIAVPLKGDLTSPVSGSATLTDAQISQLKSGMWYLNFHTAAHPCGEIRGQVLAAK